MEVVDDIASSSAQSNNSLEEDNSDDDETWDEIDAESENPIICLFCPQIFKTMAVALEHCKVVHQFNLVEMKLKFNMDCYSYICMVNYIRKEGAMPDALTSTKEAPWLNESYLSPVLQDDPWLMFDFEGLESPFENENMIPDSEFFKNIMSNVKSENGFVTLPETQFVELQQAFKYWTDQVQQKDTIIAEAVDQINEMKSVAAKIVCGDQSEENELENKISTLSVSDDHGYFKSYSHYGIHHDMLSDEVRTCSYRDAIIKNSSIFSNSIVLDVGCGTGILSMFACSAGAGQVFGVDQSDIIYHAMDIVRENDLSAKVKLIHEKVEKMTLPVDKVDVIVSEWLGYFLLFEGMLDSVLYARNKYLKPNGYMMPDRCCLYLTGLSDSADYQRMVSFWSNVYGYKMSCMTKEVLQEALVTDVPASTVATSSALVFELNLYIHGVDDTNFKSDFALTSTIDGELTALCGYFDVSFNLPHKVNFSTSPEHKKTHWKQTVFYLPEPVLVTKGMVVDGQISCTRMPDDNRSLSITIEILNQKNRYLLS